MKKHELTHSERQRIKVRIDQGEALERILTTEYMDTPVIIVHGQDNFSYERYIKSANFTWNEARRHIRGIRPNGTLPDSFHPRETTVAGVSILDEYNKSSIYMDLKRSIGVSE